MDVTAVNAVAAGSAPTTEKASLNNLDYDAFLRLLVAQLQNQDPTEPMDSTEYLGQLASFSSVEQGIQINARLDTVISKLAMAQANDIIGKTVTSADGAVTGKVAGYEVYSDGIRAVLEDGSKITLGPGVKVSGT